MCQKIGVQPATTVMATIETLALFKLPGTLVSSRKGGQAEVDPFD
jgi:hypothetical protein